jgi:hypothetical protein
LAQKDWKKVREDAIRFMYERKKVRDHRELVLEELQPYPGVFLGDDLEERIIKTSEVLRQKYIAQDDEEGMEECEKIISMIEDDHWSQIDTRAWLKRITARWQEVTEAAENMEIP